MATYTATHDVPLGRRIASLRVRAGIRAGAFAGTLAITPKHLSAIENGRAWPSLRLLQRIAGALQTTESHLLDGEAA